VKKKWGVKTEATVALGSSQCVAFFPPPSPPHCNVFVLYYPAFYCLGVGNSTEYGLSSCTYSTGPGVKYLYSICWVYDHTSTYCTGQGVFTCLNSTGPGVIYSILLVFCPVFYCAVCGGYLYSTWPGVTSDILLGRLWLPYITGENVTTFILTGQEQTTCILLARMGLLVFYRTECAYLYSMYCAVCDYLYLSDDTGGVHPARHVHRVAPDVVLRLLGPDDAGHDGPHIDADSDFEVVKRVLVDVVELLTYSQRVLGHGVHVHVVHYRCLISQPCNIPNFIDSTYVSVRILSLSRLTDKFVHVQSFFPILKGCIPLNALTHSPQAN
jgi:hypothetical protein